MSLYARILATALLVLSSTFFTSIGEGRKAPSPCIPASCGTVHNITYPFRLHNQKGPKRCSHQDPNYELSCVNNRTVFYLDSVPYYVNRISYDRCSLRLVDTRLDPNNSCSFPANLVVTKYRESNQLPFQFYIPLRDYYNTFILMECPYPLSDKPYAQPYYHFDDDVSRCFNGSSSSSSLRKDFYYIFDDPIIPSLPTSCVVKQQFPHLSKFDPYSNTVYNNTHRLLIAGFDLYWNCDYQNQHHPSPFHRLLKTLWMKFKAETLVGGLIFARITMGSMLLVAAIVYHRKRKHLSMNEIKTFIEARKDLMPLRYSYRDIEEITQGFKEKLGEGGFGIVYKGKLKSGHLVAVKLLTGSKTNGQDFISEVSTVGRIHHVNVVGLVGFCTEDSKRALVYDFMPNGSLDKFIFLRQRPIHTHLSWEQLYKIALGVARGIEYLHHGCDMQILHFDIKPHNILLDEKFTPKLSDFGLAKLYPTNNNTISLTAARGTLGYAAPELFYRNVGSVSRKTDIYSFGMLLIEMVGKRKNFDALERNTSPKMSTSWIYDCIDQQEMDFIGEVTEVERNLIMKMVIVALWCVQMKPIDRPSINEALQMLEGDVERLQMPPRPSFHPQERSLADQEIQDDMPAQVPSINLPDSLTIEAR